MDTDSGVEIRRYKFRCYLDGWRCNSCNVRIVEGQWAWGIIGLPWQYCSRLCASKKEG